MAGTAPAATAWNAKEIQISLRLLQREDYPAVAALLQRQGFLPLEETRWDALWSTNRALGDRGADWPMGWVIERDGQLVGHLTNIPLPYRLGDVPLVVATAHAWVVEPPYRNESLSLVGRWFSQPSADLVLTTSANAASGEVFSALGASRVPSPDLAAVLFWITDPRGFAHATMKRCGYGRWSWAAVPAGWGLRAVGAVRARPRRSNSLQIEALTAFDKRFDVLSEQLHASRPARLALVRTSASLDWWVGPELRSGRGFGYTALEGGRLVGFVLCKHDRRRLHGLRRARILDLQAIGDRGDVLEALLAAVLDAGRAGGVDVVELRGTSGPRRLLLDRVAAYRRRLPVWPYFYKARSPVLAQELAAPEAWDLTLIDGDTVL